MVFVKQIFIWSEIKEGLRGTTLLGLDKANYNTLKYLSKKEN